MALTQAQKDARSKKYQKAKEFGLGVIEATNLVQEFINTDAMGNRDTFKKKKLDKPKMTRIKPSLADRPRATNNRVPM
jgi:hypothetical protein